MQSFRFDCGINVHGVFFRFKIPYLRNDAEEGYAVAQFGAAGYIVFLVRFSLDFDIVGGEIGKRAALMEHRSVDVTHLELEARVVYADVEHSVNAAESGRRDCLHCRGSNLYVVRVDATVQAQRDNCGKIINAIRFIFWQSFLTSRQYTKIVKN